MFGIRIREPFVGSLVALTSIGRTKADDLIGEGVVSRAGEGVDVVDVDFARSTEKLCDGDGVSGVRAAFVLLFPKLD